MQFGYNSSNKIVGETIVRMPTKTKAGRVRALHPTKGWRSTRIDTIMDKEFNTAQRLFAAFNGGIEKWQSNFKV